jgi:hypothetical protein
VNRRTIVTSPSPAVIVRTGEQGPPGPAGPPGSSVTIVGEVEGSTYLPDDLGPEDAGDAYLCHDYAPPDVFSWTGTEWIDLGPFSGPEGPSGPPGSGNAQSVWKWLAYPVTQGQVLLGQAGVNHDEPSYASMLFIHRLADPTNNPEVDWSTTIGGLAVNDHVYLQYAIDAKSWHRYCVIGTPKLEFDVWAIPVVTESGSLAGTEPGQLENILVAFQVVTENQGPPGPSGPEGPPGPQGRSPMIWHGDGAPTLIPGASPGDLYIDDVTGDMYQLPYAG